MTSINWAITIFVGMLIFIVIFNSHTYHFNPLLGIIGYHFYEVKTSGGITYVLMTRKQITGCKDIKRIVQVTEYIVMEE